MANQTKNFDLYLFFSFAPYFHNPGSIHMVPYKIEPDSMFKNEFSSKILTVTSRFRYPEAEILEGSSRKYPKITGF